MSKVDIISGFLGAGKTTLIKKLLNECFQNEKVVLIENEFGEIGIDGAFLQDAGIEITEMNSGCICCSLVGDFSEALKKVVDEFHPDRIIIEPSGVGKLSDVMAAVLELHHEDLEVNSLVTVADVKKCRVYSTNFGEFFNNQIEYASTIVLSRTQDATDQQIQTVLDLIKTMNTQAKVITTPWDDITGEVILDAMENKDTLKEALMKEADICPVCGHHHDHDHEHHHHEHEHHHEHHHDHDEEHEHHHEHHGHHHHDHDHEHHGHHHHHHDHDHHHADEIFTSLGKETIKKYDAEELKAILNELATSEDYGKILRAKGILQAQDNTWLHFDLVPGEVEVRVGAADYTGRICVIGQDLVEEKIDQLFGVA